MRQKKHALQERMTELFDHLPCDGRTSHQNAVVVLEN